MSKTVIVNNKWDNDEIDGPILTVFVAGLHEPTEWGDKPGDVAELGWDETPTVDQTNNWLGLTVEEARDLYFGLGIMLGELDDPSVSQS